MPTKDELITDFLINLSHLGRGVAKLHNVSNMTQGQVMVMKMIADAQKQGRRGICASDISRKMAVAHPTVTPVLQNMEQRGLICRQRDEKDRRVVWITLTEHGKALFSNYYQTVHMRLGSIVDKMGKENSELLVNLLRQINEYLYYADFKDEEESDETSL